MALIDDLRQKNPNLQKYTNSQIADRLRNRPEFANLEPQEFEAQVFGTSQPETEDDSSPGFMSGVSAGVDQLQAMGGGLVMAAGEAMESEGMLNAGRDIYQRNMGEADENSLGYGFTDIRSVGDAWNWARYTAGNQLPMLAASVAGGGVGGIAVGQGAKVLAGAVAKEGAKRVGQALGAAGTSMGMETGNIMGETEALDVSLAHGVLAGSLDALTPIKMLRAAGKSGVADQAANEISDRVVADLQRSAGRSTLGAARRGSLTNMMVESTTEGLQGLINQHANYWVENNGESLLANLGEVNVKQIIDEAAAGGLMGGMVGAPAGVMERNQSRTQSQRIEQAREQVAAQGGDALDQATAGLGAEQAASSEEQAANATDGVERQQVASQTYQRLNSAMAALDALNIRQSDLGGITGTRMRSAQRRIETADRAYDKGDYTAVQRHLDQAESTLREVEGELAWMQNQASSQGSQATAVPTREQQPSNQPPQVEQDEGGIADGQEAAVIAEAEDASLTAPSLQYRTSGEAFPSERAAMASGFARRAQRNNQPVSVVPVEGGFALDMSPQAQPASQAVAEPSGAMEANADTEVSQPAQSLQYRTSGAPFPSPRSAMMSRFAREAEQNNQTATPVAVDGGFALNITTAPVESVTQPEPQGASVGAKVTHSGRERTIADTMPHPTAGRQLVSFEDAPGTYVFADEITDSATPGAQAPTTESSPQAGEIADQPATQVNTGAASNESPVNQEPVTKKKKPSKPPKLTPRQQRVSEAFGGAMAGDTVTLLNDVGYAKAGNTYTIDSINKDGTLQATNKERGSSVLISQGEWTLATRSAKAPVAEVAADPVAATEDAAIADGDMTTEDAASQQQEAAEPAANTQENAEPEPEQTTSEGTADEAPKPKRRNKPLQYTGYSGEERSVRSYQEVGDYRIAKLGDNFYEVIDPDGQAVSQMAGPNGAAREAERLNNLSPDDPRYKIGQNDARPVSSEDIKAALKGSPELSDVTVIQSTTELPAQSLLMMALQGVNPRDVRGLFVGDQLYVIADNVDSVQEGISTAVHEAVGHKGMRAVLGEDLERVMLNLYRNLPNSKEGREALREVRRDYPFLDPENRKDRITIGEEMVAHLLEKGHRPKAWQRAVAKIRELLRQLFPSVAWTYTDALALGERSREYLQKRQADSRGDDVQLYSIRSKRRVAFEKAFEDFNDNDKAAASKVGEPTITRSAMQWWQEKTNRWQARVRQGLVDQYGPLQEMDEALYGDEALTEKITQSAWVKARQSKAANGVTEVLLKHSRVEWNAKEQIFEPKDDDSMGLGAVLGRLGETAEIHRFLGWIAGNRADKLRAEGRENLFEDADIDAMKTWNRGNTADGTKRDQLYNEVFKDFQQYRDDVLAAGEVLGVISAEQRAAWRDEFYVPFYRISEGKGFEAGQLATSGLTRQQAVKKLKGGTGNLNNLLENTMMNFHHIIDAGLKNNAARQAIDNAQQLGAARKVPESAKGIEHRTFIMRDGNKEFYEIDDPLVYNALASLAHNGMNSSLMKVLRGFKRIFTNTVTVTPQYIIANLMRDSIQAPATSDISKNVLSNILVGNRTLRDQKMKARMLASGASFSFGHLYGTGNADELRAGMTRNLRDAAAADAPGSSLPLGIGNVASVVRYGWARWNDVNNHTENLNRAAIFSQNASEGNKLRAAHEARDLMDFSSHGGWGATRVLIDIIPFLNARIQGLDKIYRSGVKPGGSVIIDALRGKTPNATDKQLAGRFWAVTGAVSLAMLALYLENHDEEWYKELEEWEKDTYTHFNIGSQKFRIPNPFEVGAIGTMMVRTAEQFVDDEATGELFAQRMWHMMTQTFAVGMPQAMQPALDVYANKDSFTNRPIENMGMQNLSPELRKRYNTTVVATGISNLLNSTVGAIGRPETNPLALSPVQVDHLIGGYLGQVGAWGAGMADTIWRTANGHDAPDRKWYEFNPIRRFYGNLDDTDAYTRYGTIFYEGLTETRRAYSDVNELRELGHWEEAKEHFEENRNTLALRRGLNRAQTQLSTFNKQIDIIRRSNIGGELKRQRIDRIQEKKRIIQRTWGERVLQARAT